MEFEERNCSMGEVERSQFDVVSILKLMTACLSILGAFSIVCSAIHRKTVCNQKIYPIFILSLADTLLSVLWISGSLVWLRGGVQHYVDLRVGCFSINIMTVVLQCIAMNLTLLYAFLAHHSLNSYTDYDSQSVHRQVLPINKGPRLGLVSLYLLAWVLPVVLIVTPFAVFSSRYSLIQKARNLTCWCLPYFGNVLPRPQIGFNANNEQEMFLIHLHYFITSYAVVLCVNFIVVLLCMTVIYVKILLKIRRMRLKSETMPLNGATSAMIIGEEKEAKKRVLFFILIYFFTGIITFLYGLLNISIQFYYIDEHKNFPTEGQAMKVLYGLMVFEALFVPIQGFLNALAYGWTRRGFIRVVSSQKMTVPNYFSSDLMKSIDTVESTEEIENDEIDSDRNEWFDSNDEQSMLKNNVTPTSPCREKINS